MGREGADSYHWVDDDQISLYNCYLSAILNLSSAALLSFHTALIVAVLLLEASMKQPVNGRVENKGPRSSQVLTRGQGETVGKG